MYDSRRLRGWNRFTGGSLVAFASISVRLGVNQEGGEICFGAFQQVYAVYDSRRLRELNCFAGGSLVTFASILVCRQAKREGGDYVLASFNKIVLCMILAGCTGGTVPPAAL